MELEIGQTVYLKPQGNAGRRSTEIIPAKIEKIGRKYFEVDYGRANRIIIETMCEDGLGWVSNYSVYLSLDEIEQERQAQLVFADLKKHFSSNNTSLSLEQLRAISKIITP